MASEKWGYLLSIPNEGNHRLYIVLFMAGQGVCAHPCVCVCVCQMVDVMLRACSEGQGKEKAVLSLPDSLSSVLNECIVICFPSQTHLYFYWITPDAQPEPT